MQFEISKHSDETQECRLSRKVKTQAFVEGDKLDLRPLKHSLVVHGSDGTFEYYNMTFIKEAFRQKPHVRKGTRLGADGDYARIAEVKVLPTASSFILTRRPGSLNEIILYDSLNPHIR